jgi:hypothetical protein
LIRAFASTWRTRETGVSVAFLAMSKPFADSERDSAIDVSSGSGKQALAIEENFSSPASDTNKQTFDRGADSGKEVHQVPPSDTDKIFVPRLPPVSSDKQVAVPMQDTDKELLHNVDSRSSTETGPPKARTPVIHHFRIEKATPLGLIMPQHQQFTYRALDPTTKTDRGPAFITSDMEWVDVLTVNPPHFEIYTTHDFGGANLVSRFRPTGWQGLVGMKGDFECSVQGDRQLWEIVRKGLSRSHQLRGPGRHQGVEYAWKGSRKTAKEMVGQASKGGIGSLKLVAGRKGEETVLALWEQWRGAATLGDLLIFESAENMDVGVEVVITSLMAVVCAERASGMNWIGGLGKG